MKLDSLVSKRFACMYGITKIVFFGVLHRLFFLALVKVIDSIHVNSDSGLNAAFNSVQNKSLLNRRENGWKCFVSGTGLSWVKSYFGGRNCAVFIGDQKSKTC